MGEASRKKQIVLKDFLSFLSENKSEYRLIYPYEEREGILSQNIHVFAEAFSRWKMQTGFSPELRLRLIDTWIVDYNRILKSGYTWTLETTLLTCNLAGQTQFQKNMFAQLEKLNKEEGKEKPSKNENKGNTILYSVSCFLTQKLRENPRIIEAVLCPALFNLDSKIYEPDQVILDNEGETFFNRTAAEAFEGATTHLTSFLSEIIEETPYDWNCLKVG